ncbi:MAG: hypothetical protein ACIALR_15200 [Blastopirellula sp. JB062]
MPAASTWTLPTSTSVPHEFASTNLQLAVRIADQLDLQLADIESGREQALSLELDAKSPLESYVRENDLVFTSEEAPDAPVRTQVYIRGLADEAACELILSRQTSLLDCAAPMSLRLPANQPLRLSNDRLVSAQSSDLGGDDLALLLQADAQTACCLLFYPGDADQIEVSASHLIVRCFTAPLEKGVIRRVRARLFFASLDGIESTLTAQYAKFRQSELPLTT